MPTRVLMSVDAVGGVWSYGMELARAYGARGVETALVTLGPAPDEPKRREAQRAPGVSLIETDLPLDWTAGDVGQLERAARWLTDLASAIGADVVHLNVPALAALARFSSPTIVTAHSCVATWWRAVRQGPLPADFEWRRQCMADGLAAASAVIAPSHGFAAALREIYGARAPITVVHNGLSPVPVPAWPKRRLALTAGRLWDEGKNTATLDRAAAAIGMPFVAAGPLAGPNGAAIRLDHLRSVGALDRAALAAWYEAAGVFASAARYEPFGLAPLEAASTGAALVLSDIPTFREIWSGAATFVDADDHAGFAASIRALLTAPAAMNEAGRRARARAQDYSGARMAEATLEIYRVAMSATARRAA